MNSTDLGRTMRQIRKARGENLATLAEKYGTSIAYLSAIEVGNKSIPDDYADKIDSFYHLTNDEKVQLANAIDVMRKKTIIPLKSLSDEKQATTMMFARKINGMDQKTLEELRKLLENKE